MCSGRFVSEPCSVESQEEICRQTCVVLLFTVTKSFTEPIQHYIYRGFILGGKATGREADHSLTFSADNKDGWRYGCCLS
jgi:hypothetical protein